MSFDTLRQDLRHALRSMRRDPGFTGIAVVTLALGIGLNTALFSCIRHVLLQPLPYTDAGRLVRLFEANPARDIAAGPVGPATFVAWRDQNRTLASVEEASTSPLGMYLTFNTRSALAREVSVSPGFFALLGARPALGRLTDGYVLSFDFWRREFGADPNVVGTPAAPEGGGARTASTVAGVMPEWFRMPEEAEIWAVVGRRSPASAPTDSRRLGVLARLKPGITVEQARSDLATISRRLAAQFPRTHAGWRPEVVTLQDSIVGSVRPALVAVYGATLLLLVLACASVANLSRARAVARRREFAIRVALGAGRWRLIRQSLTEHLLLALSAGVVGVFLAAAMTRALRAFGPATIPRLEAVRVDGSAVLVAAGLLVVTAVLITVASLGRAAARDVLSWLKGQPARARRPFLSVRDAIVVVQIALALTLLVASTLLLATFRNLVTVPLGFDSDRVLTIQLRHPILKAGEVVRHYPTPRFAAVTRETIRRVAELPGVTSVGTITFPPLTRTPVPIAGWTLDGPVAGSILLVEPVAPVGARTFRAAQQVVSPGFFSALRVPIVRGRPFTDSDDSTAGQLEEDDPTRQPGSVIISTGLAARLWPGRDAVGRYIALETSGFKSHRIVGVAGDVRLAGLTGAAEAVVYLPYAQQPVDGFTLMVRSTQPPAAIASLVRKTIAGMGGDLGVGSIGTMSAIVDEKIAVPRFDAVAVTLFGLLGLVLAYAGIYGVVAFLTAQRTAEFGIRMALGARPSAIGILVLSQTARIAGAGIVLGLAGAVAAGRFLRGLLFGVPPVHMGVLVSMSVLVGVVAVAACAGPARRATRGDLLATLRAD